MSSVLFVVYLVLLAGCALAVLLTAFLFLIKKKATKSLALYALCIAALLGLGFFASRDNPLPNLRHIEPKPVAISPGSQHPDAPWPIAPQPEPVEDENVNIPVEPAPEPEPEPAEDIPAEPAVKTAPVTVKNTSRSTAAPVSATAPAPTSEPAQEPEPAATPISAEPTLMEDPEPAPMPNPTLVEDTETSFSPEPELVDE